MQNELFEMVNQYNENMLAAAKRLGEINMRAFEQMANKQAEIMNDCFESSTKQYEVLTTAKDYKDAMKAQSELLKGCSDKFMVNMRDTAEMMTSVREELTVLVEDTVKFTSDSIEKAGEMATKKAA